MYTTTAYYQIAKGKNNMIVFEGQITGECLKKFNKIRNTELLVVSIGILVAWFCTNIVAISILKTIDFSLTIVSLCTLGILPLLAFKLYYRYKPFGKIAVDVINNCIILTKGKKQKFIKIDDIDEIHDMKIFYYIPQAEDIVLCQKSLLTEGTIEEFEKLFDGKITKK
jgi:hypothetical protein